jgi:hypothetical protein
VQYVSIVEVTEADGGKEITGVFGFDTEPAAIEWSRKADETWQPGIPTTFVIVPVDAPPAL